MNRLHESTKYDVALAPVSLASDNATGQYFEFQKYRDALAVITTAGIAETQTAILALFEATDELGTSSQAISGATITHTANASANTVTATLVSVSVDDTIIINGLTYTAKASATLASRFFDQSGTDTADAASLVTAVNDADYGVPGVFASNSSGVLTLRSTDGETTITATETGTTITLATLTALGIVDLSNYDLSDTYTHIAAKVTTDSTQVVGVTLVRGSPRGHVTQSVAAVAI